MKTYLRFFPPISSILILIFLISSCDSLPRKNASNNTPTSKSVVQYASGFQLYQDKGQSRIVVFDPWQKGKVMAQFILVKGKAAKGQIHVPLNEVAVFSATQLNALERLGVLDRVTGISEATYVKNKRVRSRLKQHKITELAAGGNYFVEKILAHPPRAIFFSPYQSSQSLPVSLSGILAVPYLDFMESSPLGRAEWIKFTAAFFGKERKADSLFRDIEQQYAALKKRALKSQNRPTVFSDKYFNGQWYLPGGKSYVAQLFKDAGADYIWKKNPDKASFPLDFETVFAKAQQADFWRIVGTFGSSASYQTLASENQLYTHFKAFQQHHILYCDPEATAYFEKSPLEPQFMLADFIKAFHPELLPDYKPHYYKILP
jgi:iron complex transport system substrate-binding protein